VVVLAVASLSLFSIGIVSAEDERTVEEEVTVTFTTVEQVSEGETWEIGGVTQITGQQYASEVSGAIEGTSVETVGYYFASSCDTAEVCADGWYQWVEFSVTDANGTWSGNGMVYYDDAASDDTDTDVAMADARIVLIGHGGNAGKAIRFNSVVERDGGSITLGGLMATASGVRQGLHVSADLCLTGEGMFAGGYLAHGAVEGSGSLDGELRGPGVLGPLTLNGKAELATPDGEVVVVFAADHAAGDQFYGTAFVHGEFEYWDMIGAGKAMLTLVSSPSCVSGVGATMHVVADVWED
jgi:hypothetical protein